MPRRLPRADGVLLVVEEKAGLEVWKDGVYCVPASLVIVGGEATLFDRGLS